MRIYLIGVKKIGVYFVCGTLSTATGHLGMPSISVTNCTLVDVLPTRPAVSVTLLPEENHLAIFNIYGTCLSTDMYSTLNVISFWLHSVNPFNGRRDVN